MATLRGHSNSNAVIAFYVAMKGPLSNGAGIREAEPEDLSADNVAIGEVLFEMGAILTAHLAVALSVVLTLRLLGL